MIAAADVVFSEPTVDLISIDRRSAEKEAECLERARVLAAQFLEKVSGTNDFVWKSQDSITAAPALDSQKR